MSIFHHRRSSVLSSSRDRRDEIRAQLDFAVKNSNFKYLLDRYSRLSKLQQKKDPQRQMTMVADRTLFPGMNERQNYSRHCCTHSELIELERERERRRD
jgi:hypothetical protein